MGLSILLLSLLPAVVYILIIYFTVPYKTINLKTAFVYLIVGFMSVGLLKYFWLFFPEWLTIAEITSSTNADTDAFTYYHHYFFIQVAFIEEMVKLTIFLIVDKYRRKTQSVVDHPIAIMFYMAMVSLGFAVIENIQYATMFGEGVLYWRAFTALIGHMVFGLFMGYWIAMGRINNRLYDRSLFDIIINKRKRLRNVLYTIIGIIAATILHGIYNLNLHLNGPEGITTTYMLLTFSLIGAYWCFRNLTRLYNKEEKERSS